MKKILLLFVASIMFSCSTEEESKEPEETVWHVSVVEECKPDNNDEKSPYCISQSVYNEIYSRIRQTDGACLWIDDLEDLENNLIKGYVMSLGKSEGQCVT